MQHEHTNALINETSPYLLQHAHNPVNWHPWSDETLEKAKRENKLMLISVGYSACHWCHVMERETFENDSAASFMNDHFINIKVDREERPDVDQIYMNAVQLMTNRGGWPLNCFALPDGRPVYGGTYFPTDQWMQVLKSLIDLQTNEPEKMIEYAERLTEGIQKSELIERPTADVVIEKEAVDSLVNKWKPYWDINEGGGNHAPKFPLPNNYAFLLHYGSTRNDREILDFVKLTLDKMAMGGIYDQIGGGFARYSVDHVWKVPHFEKMLYDNAQLVSLYSEGYRVFGEPAYKQLVEQTLDFIARELTATEGGFYSALDADTEGEEGKFYVWKEEELRLVLGELYPFAASYYNINSRGHWEHGNYILLRNDHPAVYAEKNGMKTAEVHEKVTQVNQRLFAARAKRTRPGLDDKQLTSWNALMVKAYADAYRTFGQQTYLDAALKAMNHLLTNCRRSDGGLWHSYKNSEARINGYLEDYAFVCEALIALHQATFDESHLHNARELTDYAMKHFLDAENGMFWFTSDLDAALIARKQEIQDNVIPSSNSVMAHVLYQLGTLLDDKSLLEKSQQMVKNIAGVWDFGQSYSNWASLALNLTETQYVVAISGKNTANALKREFDTHYLPDALLLGGNDSTLPLMRGKASDTVTFYVCIEGACKLPVNTPSDAIAQMRDN